MPPDPEVRATPPRRERGTLALAGVVLVVALGAGYLGAQIALRPVRTALETRPPVVVLDLATVLKDVAAESAGAVIAAQRELATRLAAGGVLVLDAQAVLAAPADAYLKRQEVTGD
jgi:hypothetical protein